MITIYFTTLAFIIIFLLNKFRFPIANKIKLIDKPDNIRKYHEKETPLLGGLMLFSIFLLSNIYLIFFQNTTITDLIFFLSCFFCFALGLIDDSRNLNYKYKFFLLYVFYYILIAADPNLQINKLYFETLNKEIYLKDFDIFFTVLCLMLLTNSLNLIDGIDGLCITIAIIWLGYIMFQFSNFDFFYFLIFFSLIYILFLNLKKNIFLGDSGALLLGSILGLFLIRNYNIGLSKNYFSVEDIFILLMLPGLDMLRLFVERITHKKNPFKADRNHLHHLFLRRSINPKIILIIFFILTLIPIILNLITNINPILIILSYIIFYIILIINLKKTLRSIN